MTLASIPLMDRTGRRTLHLYGLGGMFIFSIFITISFLIKASLIACFITRIMLCDNQRMRIINGQHQVKWKCLFRVGLL